MTSPQPVYLVALMTAALLLASAGFGTATNDEDFAFDVADDLEVEFETKTATATATSSDEIMATIGRVFYLAVAHDKYEENVKYEARRKDGKPLPHWLLFDKSGAVFWGVPLYEDAGKMHIIVRTVMPKNDVIKEFTLYIEESLDESAQKCPQNEDNTVLSLLIDRGIHSIKPKQRVIAVNNLAKFFGVPYSAFNLRAMEESDDLADSAVILAGPGDEAKPTSKSSSLIQIIIGCDGRLWHNFATIVHQLKHQAKEGTIGEVLRLPLIGWRVKSESKSALRSKRQVDDFGSGGGDYDDNYYDDYDYDNEEYDDYDPKSNIGGFVPPTAKTTTTPKPTTTTTIPTTTTRRTTTTTTAPTTTTTTTTPAPTTTTATTTTTSTTTLQPTIIPESSSTHHHRHHHGQILSEETSNKVQQETTSVGYETPKPSTSAVITEPPSGTEKVNLSPEYTLNELESDNDDDEDDYEDEDDIESETIVPLGLGKTEPKFEMTDTYSTVIDSSITKPQTVEFIPETTPLITTSTTTSATTITTTSTTTTTEAPTTTEQPTTLEIVTEQTEIPTTTPLVVPSTEATTKLTTEPAESTTTVKQTTARHITTKPPTTTTYMSTEPVEFPQKNYPPRIQNRLKRIATTAGKIFSFIVPRNTFTDVEDGDNLHMEFLDPEGNMLNASSWCQFNPVTREIYGLPLEEDVSRWEYLLRATDKDGANVSDKIEVSVQHHKSRRTVNHEFSLYMHIEKKWEFPHDVDWALKTLRAIGQLYQHSNVSDITVRRVGYNTEPVSFVWTNDSLPKSYCPTVEIERLYEKLTANNEGDPSIALTRVLSPELRVKKVMFHYLGICETKPQTPPLAPITPPTNFSPILRNPVDHINATVGELLVFKVPDDTFYDPEDVDSRNLKMSLLTVDRQQIPSDHWLQFDSKNKEFYGIPLPLDVGRSEYHLVCEDTGGLPASDSLVVVVHAPPRLQYNVEFSMTLETPYETFAKSANMQRKFVEKLQTLFGDQNTSFIHLSSISSGSTIVSWYNRSLSVAECPRADIKQLESVLVNNDRTIAGRVQDVMDPEFTVSTIKLQLIGSCKGRPSIQSPTSSKGVPVEEPPLTDHEDYLITFILPAVIIAAMLLMAGLAACVLYRRRRTGKMNVEEDGRGSYGNKGIPVIFQEELEEKPEPGTKAPLILKDEKPPLAPPEYSKSGSLKLGDDSEPYQPPPPPFTRPQDNGRQPRPKPTPTYRKPPPYVPP